jgi:hypothetical protein
MMFTVHAQQKPADSNRSENGGAIKSFKDPFFVAQAGVDFHSARADSRSNDCPGIHEAAEDHVRLQTEPDLGLAIVFRVALDLTQNQMRYRPVFVNKELCGGARRLKLRLRLRN